MGPVMENPRSFAGGQLLTNTYLLDTPSGRPLLVDAPPDTEKWLARLDVRPAALLLTHQHFDHVASAAAIAALGVPVYAFAPFSRELTGEALVRQWGMPFDVPAFAVDHVLKGLETLELEGLRLNLAHVPGHSPDSVVFHDAERGLLFGGDTLFEGSTGRGDLPGGNLDLLCRGIVEKLYVLPEETRVFPGHGPSTTIGTERRTNAIVRA